MQRQLDTLSCAKTKAVSNKHLDFNQLPPASLVRLYFLANSRVFKEIKVEESLDRTECILSGRVTNFGKVFNLAPHVFCCALHCISKPGSTTAFLDRTQTPEMPTHLKGGEVIEFKNLCIHCSYNEPSVAQINVEASVTATGPVPPGMSNVHKIIFSRLTKNFIQLLEKTHV